jgi:hypothetical protein
MENLGLNTLKHVYLREYDASALEIWLMRRTDIEKFMDNETGPYEVFYTFNWNDAEVLLEQHIKRVRKSVPRRSVEKIMRAINGPKPEKQEPVALSPPMQRILNVQTSEGKAQ